MVLHLKSDRGTTGHMTIMSSHQLGAMHCSSHSNPVAVGLNRTIKSLV